ncbi:MAG: M1 family metallopeptidase, partial [Bacteroidetes bacterium]|nr:M1 family metallopeptidase [Bacteroidota bacterium]
MKIIFSSILIVLVTTALIHAQTENEFIEFYCSKPNVVQRLDKISLQPHEYDVIYYDIYLDWYQVLKNVNRNYSGNVLIRAKVDTVNSLNQIKVNCGLSVDSVTQNGAIIPYSLASNVLTINLNRTYNKGEIFEVKIYFRRTRSDNLGFYYYAQSSQTFENLAYTMTEPSDARFWFPCYDDPSDKADSARITIKVPNGYSAGSNGLLRSKTTIGDSTTFIWIENHPITTYLLVVTASKYSSFSQFYNSNFPPNEQIEVQHYFWKSDSTQAVYVARNIPTMMQCFEAYYGKYPFVKYGHAYVQPFSFGGMEHQTLSTIHRNWLTHDAQSGIAHELAHMWWGDLVTCETWKDIWLNEGFATFSEDLYREYTQGKDIYFASMNVKANFYYSNNPGYAIYNPAYIFNAAISYYKGALVLNMMRFVLGDSLFFKSLMDYKNQHLYSTATTNDFKNSVSATIGSDFSYFINQWIYQPNHPQYVYNWNVQ